MFNVRIIFSNLCGCDEFLSLVWVSVFGLVVIVLGIIVGGRGVVRFVGFRVVGVEWGVFVVFREFFFVRGGFRRVRGVRRV